MYYWWKGSDLAPMFAEIMARGVNNVRLEFHPHDKDPRKSVFYVLGPGEKDGSRLDTLNGGFNFAHPCPPDCD